MSFHWGAPSLLAFLPLALAPILLHFWRRRRTDVVYWAAFDFLADALQETRRRLRIENWLHLLLRTLLLLFLILAAANPQPGRSLPISTNDTAGRHRIFVIDVSYSMDYNLGGITPLERAKSLLQDVIENGRPEDTYSLVTMSGRPRAVVPEPTRNQKDVLMAVDELTTAGSAVNVPATCNVVADLLRTSDRGAVTSTVHEVVFITDLRQAGWGATSTVRVQGTSRDSSRNVLNVSGDETLQGGPIVSALSQLARRASVAILDVGFPRSTDESFDLAPTSDIPISNQNAIDEGGPPSTLPFSSAAPTRNIGIESITTQNAPHTVGQTMRIDLSIRNWSAESIANFPVELYVNGRQVLRTTMNLPGQRISPVALRYRFDRPGRFLLEARIPDDSLVKDNVRRMVVEARDSLRVLLVEETGSVSGTYIEAALSPFGGDTIALGERPAIDVTRARISRWTSIDSNEFDCVILCDPVQFSTNEIRLLRSRLNRGSGVVLFLGPRVDLVNFNAKLLDIPLDTGETPLLPGRLTGPRPNSVFRIDPLDYKHPITYAFEGNRQSGLLTTPIENYQHLELRTSPDVQPALNMGNGDPFVVTQDFHPGRLVCVTTSPSPEWASLSYWPSFLPLTHEVVRYAVLGNRSYREYVSGDVLEFTVPESRNQALRVRHPDGAAFPLLQEENAPASAASLFWEETDQVGVYTLEPLESLEAENEVVLPSPFTSPLGLLAVNSDPLEGNPARISEESLVFPPESRIRIVKALNAADLERSAALGPVSDFRHVRFLLIFALLLSFTELYWSRRLARH